MNRSSRVVVLDTYTFGLQIATVWNWRLSLNSSSLLSSQTISSRPLEQYFRSLSYTNCGIPQRFAIGSSFFVIYMNDIVVDITIVLFEDDPTLF